MHRLLSNSNRVYTSQCVVQDTEEASGMKVKNDVVSSSVAAEQQFFGQLHPG